jgi:hypothetical protein
MTGFAAVLEALGGTGPGMYLCPAHADERTSLSVAEGDDGRALLLCFAGCPTPNVVEALGLQMADLFADHRGDAIVQDYLYTDAEGRPLIRVRRKYPKGFTQQSWDPQREMWRDRIGNTERVPFHLPQLIKAKSVWIVEGEKDVESMERAGEVATTVMGGAGKWRPEYAEWFRGKTVAFIADIDEPDKFGRRPGMEGVLRIKSALRGVAKGLTVWESAAGKDVTDHFNAGYTVEDLVRVETTSAAIFEPRSWADYEDEHVEWLFKPYLPVASRVLAFGKRGALKSLWAMWCAAKLAEEGHKVAYFNLEMRPADAAARLRSLAPPPENFKWFSKFSFENPSYLAAACELLKGYSLVVIDSWSAVQAEGLNSNDTVAALDREVFQPLVEETGATLLVIDNTGHDAVTDKGIVQMRHVRGASAKEDKMDVALMFSRPDENDNYRVNLSVTKMRLNEAIPKMVSIRTSPHHINFEEVDSRGVVLGPHWGDGAAKARARVTVAAERPGSLLERLKQAKAQDRLGLDNEPQVG